MLSYEEIEQHFKDNRTRHIKWLTRAAGSVEDAEDIHQEAYARALRYRASCRPGETNRWIDRIIHRCLIDKMNDNKGHLAEELDELTAGTIDCPTYPNRVLEEVYALISTKIPAHQEILNLHFKMEYSPRDIAHITEYPYQTCYKAISRFREELRGKYS